MTYPGGKSADGVFQRLINQIPPCELFVEAFAGSGLFRHMRPARSTLAVDVDAAACAQLRALDYPGLEVVQADAVEWLRSREWGRGTFVYADPPYLFETRSSHRRLYNHEFGTPEEHRRLLAVLRGIPGPVMVSGYWSDLYAAELVRWRRISYPAKTRGGRVVQEYAWCNYAEPAALQDYRYLGADYRERERIRKQQRRWRLRVQRMDRLQRFALLAALQDLTAESGEGSGGPPAETGGGRHRRE